MNDRRIGATLGPYRLESSLGRGGMGTVYLATQTALNRRVALKLLSPALADEPGFVERFRREAMLAASLKHPHIVTVHDFGEDGELLYLVMEYIAGGTLKERAEGPMDPRLAAKLIAQVADALDHAHEQGIVHRDIKPANILLERPEFAKLVDFGIARLAEDSQHLTRTGVGMGTPEYMSPEQGEGLRTIDGRSDIYSLGIVLFDLLSGETPFRLTSPLAVLRQHAEKPMPVATLLQHGVPPGLIQIVMRATAKRPEQRYARAGEMRDALEAFLGAPAKQSAVAPASAATAVASLETGPVSPASAEAAPDPLETAPVPEGLAATALATNPVEPFGETSIEPAVAEAPPAGTMEETGLAALIPPGESTVLRILSFIGSRIAQLMVINLVIVTAIFFFTRVVRNPISSLPGGANAATIERIRSELHLNDPPPLQYLRFLGDSLRGEYGRSLTANRSATDITGGAWPMTLALAGLALLASVAAGIPLAALAAVLRRGPASFLPRYFALAFQSLPVIVTGAVLLVLFAIRNRLLPAFGSGSPQHFVIPVTVLTLVYLPAVMRAGAASGRAWQGELGRRQRALRAIGAALSVGIFELGALFGALIVVETLFAWPGVGRVLTTSAFQRDVPVMTAAALGITGLLTWIVVLGGIPRAVADWQASAVALFADDYRSLGAPPEPAASPRSRVLLLIPGIVILTIILLVVLGSFLPAVNPIESSLADRLRAPGGRYILGTDQLGRDVADRILVGIRSAMAIAVGSALAAGIGGGIAGALAGFLAGRGAGWILAPLAWLGSTSRAIPLVLWLVIALAAAGTGYGANILATAIWLWPLFFALAAGLVMEGRRPGGLRIAAIALGGVAFAMAVVILNDGYLGLLGLGLPPPSPTLGGIAADGRQFLENAFWLQTTGFVLAFLVFAFNLLGDTLANIMRIRRPS